jgi:hypothetical protein
MAIAIG